MDIIQFFDTIKPVSGYVITHQFIDFYFKDEITNSIRTPGGKVETDPFYYCTLAVPIDHKYIFDKIQCANNTLNKMPYARTGWVHTILAPRDLCSNPFQHPDTYEGDHTFGMDCEGDIIELCRHCNFIFDVISSSFGNVTCIHAIGYDEDGYTEVMFSFDLQMFYTMGSGRIQQMQGYFKVFNADHGFDICSNLMHLYSHDDVCMDEASYNRAVPNQNFWSKEG